MFDHESILVSHESDSPMDELLRRVRCYLQDETYASHFGLFVSAVGELKDKFRFSVENSVFLAVELHNIEPLAHHREIARLQQPVSIEAKAKEIANNIMNAAVKILMMTIHGRNLCSTTPVFELESRGKAPRWNEVFSIRCLDTEIRKSFQQPLTVASA